MATTETTPDRGRRVAVVVLAGCGLLFGGFVLAALLNRPPQMGTDEEAFKAVDALYTAVRNRDEKRLDECERRLRGYREEGKLPAEAAGALDAIIRKARSGSWETAAERLYEFMLAQRREGAVEPHHDKKTKSPPVKGR